MRTCISSKPASAIVDCCFSLRTKSLSETEKKNLNAEKKKKETMEVPIPSLCARLYKHALESIFSHLNLSELAHVSATCRNWSAAVDSMRPIGAYIYVNRFMLRSMCNSRLVRQVSEIELNSGGEFILSSLANIIKQSKSLTSLISRCNRIGNVGASAIAEAIQQSQSLTTVDLCYNNIGNVGASAIAEAIKQSKSLITVYLRFNRFGIPAIIGSATK